MQRETLERKVVAEELKGVLELKVVAEELKGVLELKVVAEELKGVLELKVVAEEWRAVGVRSPSVVFMGRVAGLKSQNTLVKFIKNSTDRKKSMPKSRCRQLTLKPILTGIRPPTIIKTAILPGEQVETLFLATADGFISTVQPQWHLKPFLQIQDLIAEDGLHGLEFHSNFSENGRFYLHYSVHNSHYDTVEEWLLPSTGIAICVRTILNIRCNHIGRNTLSWADGGLILLTGGGSDDNSSLLGKIISIDVDQQPWRYSKNPQPAEDTTQLDPIRRQSIRIVAKGLQDPAGCSTDGPDKYLADAERIFAFIKWRRHFGHEQPLFSKASSERIIGGCVYQGHRIPELQQHYVFADGNGDLFAIHRDGAEPRLLTTGTQDLIPTALGSNRRRTRLFVGAYQDNLGGLYELTV